MKRMLLLMILTVSCSQTKQTERLLDEFAKAPNPSKELAAARKLNLSGSSYSIRFFDANGGVLPPGAVRTQNVVKSVEVKFGTHTVNRSISNPHTLEWLTGE